MDTVRRDRGEGTYRKRANGGFQIRYSRNGVAVEESVARMLGKPPAKVTAKDARTALRVRLAQVSAGTFVGPKSERLTVKELCDDYLRDLKLRKGEASCVGPRCHLALLEPIHDHRASALLTSDVQAWMEDTLADGYAPQTVNHGIAMLSSAFRLAMRTGVLAKSPYLPRLAVDNARQGFFERAEFQAIAAELSPVLRDLAWFAYLSGRRKRELLGLRWEHVDRAHATYTLPTTKNGQRQTLPLVRIFDPGYGEDLAAVIDRRWKSRILGSEMVFPRNDGGERDEIWEMWRHACRRAGFWEWIDEARDLWQATKMFHDLRRTFARDALNAGVPESVIMKQGGWKSRGVFLRYAIVSQDDLRLAQRTLAAHREVAR